MSDKGRAKYQHTLRLINIIVRYALHFHTPAHSTQMPSGTWENICALWNENAQRLGVSTHSNVRSLGDVFCNGKKELKNQIMWHNSAIESRQSLLDAQRPSNDSAYESTTDDGEEDETLTEDGDGDETMTEDSSDDETVRGNDEDDETMAEDDSGDEPEEVDNESDGTSGDESTDDGYGEAEEEDRLRVEYLLRTSAYYRRLMQW